MFNDKTFVFPCERGDSLETEVATNSSTASQTEVINQVFFAHE